MSDDTTDAKIKALAKYLEIEPDEVTEQRWGAFEADGGEYLVLTDDEADQRVGEQIEESVWAFRAAFLSAHSDADQEVFEALQKTNKCEGLNRPIRSLIRDWDHFVEDAIRADGRGHFLAGYDFEEIELEGGLFAYRVN